MHRYIALTLGTIALVVLSACELAEVEDPIVVSRVEKEFKVGMWEALSPEQRTFQLQIETLEPAPCLNTEIATQVNRTGQRLRLSLLAIAQPENCDPGTEPAQATASYGPLTPGFYDMVIDLKETVENEGRLLVFNDRYELSLATTKGLELEKRVLRRVPERTIWGYVAYDDKTNEALRDTFHRAVEAFTVQPAYPAGDYGYFDIAEKTRNLVLADYPEESYVDPFILRLTEGDIPAFRKVLEQVRRQLPEGVRVQVDTWQGEAW